MPCFALGGEIWGDLSYARSVLSAIYHLVKQKIEILPNNQCFQRVALQQNQYNWLKTST
jgi:hypothetical protein